MNFYKRPGGESKTGRGRPGKGLAGEAVFCRSFQSDFTNEMGNDIQPNEPEATASMPMLPKIALRGNFLLVIDHFISEITDCTQQQKTEISRSTPRRFRLRFASGCQGAFGN